MRWELETSILAPRSNGLGWMSLTELVCLFKEEKKTNRQNLTPATERSVHHHRSYPQKTWPWSQAKAVDDAMQK